MQDSILDNNCILSTAYNINSSGGLLPIFATDSYFNFMVYPVQYWSNSGVSSYIELQRKSNMLSINRVIGYGGWCEQVLPIIVTKGIYNVTNNTALSGGIVLNEGSSVVTTKGVCINTSGNPTINDGITNDGSGIGAFVSNITGMNPNTTYYLRAYATNNAGTSYGNQIYFETT